jgi:hypothetical protein
VCGAGSVCVPVTPDAHSDGRRDGGETGVDCGGSIAMQKPCGAGQGCVAASDCEGTMCLANQTCNAPTTSDGKKSPSLGETDVDCGGAMAPKCLHDKTCAVPSDCYSGFCTNNVCESTNTSRKDGQETDLNCGGGMTDLDTGMTVARCADTQACLVDGDCANGNCSRVTHTCVAGRSCRSEIASATAGITSCGRKEVPDMTKTHDSCCTSLPLPSSTVRLDKYEITAGRMRQFIESVKAMYAGVPNVRAWMAAEAAANSAVWQHFKANFPAGATYETQYRNYLPQDLAGPLGLIWQLGGAAMDGTQPSTSQGCYNDYSSGGHSTYWFSQAELQNVKPGHPRRYWPEGMAEASYPYDEKSLNCTPYMMFAAFCAWDGGRLPTFAEDMSAWNNATTYPWGNTWDATYSFTAPTHPRTSAAGIDYETAVNFNNNSYYFYHYPGYAVSDPPPGTGYYDLTGYISAPGRFPLDLTALKSANGDGWYDLAANMMEVVQYDATLGTGTFCDQSNISDLTPSATTCNDGSKYGASRGTIQRAKWVGGSWEGHGVAKTNFSFPLHTQYGKMGARCAR